MTSKPTDTRKAEGHSGLHGGLMTSKPTDTRTAEGRRALHGGLMTSTPIDTGPKYSTRMFNDK